MSKIEDQLRRRLKEAANLAPTFQHQDAARKVRRRPFALVALAAGVAVAAGGILWGTSPRDVDPPTARCVAELVFNDTKYVAYGDVRRVPRSAEPAGTATQVRCEGAPSSGTVTVFAAEGYEPADIILVNGAPWISQIPPIPELESLFLPTVCAATDEFKIVGTVIGVTSDKETTQDGQLAPPFTLDIEATNGPAWLLSDYQTVRISGLVDSTTRLASDHLVGDALSGATPIQASIRCRTGRYELVGLTLDR